MLHLFYISLLSYMLFFSICIAPQVNKVLDRKNSSKLLRKIFPLNFTYGAIISLVLICTSIYESHLTSLVLSAIIFLLFIFNLFYLVPKINAQADLMKKTDIIYKRNFKRLHLFSVLCYLIQMIITIIFLIIF